MKRQSNRAMTRYVKQEIVRHLSHHGFLTKEEIFADVDGSTTLKTEILSSLVFDGEVSLIRPRKKTDSTSYVLTSTYLSLAVLNERHSPSDDDEGSKQYEELVRLGLITV